MGTMLLLACCWGQDAPVIVKTMRGPDGQVRPVLEAVRMGPPEEVERQRRAKADYECRVALYVVAVLRSKALPAEYNLSSDERAELALLANELQARDDAFVEKSLAGMADAAQIDHRRRRIEQDQKLLVEGLGAARAERVRQLVRHYEGIRRTLLVGIWGEDLLVGISRAEITELLIRSYNDWKKEKQAADLSTHTTTEKARQELGKRFYGLMPDRQRAAWDRLLGPLPKLPKPTEWPVQQDGFSSM